MGSEPQPADYKRHRRGHVQSGQSLHERPDRDILVQVHEVIAEQAKGERHHASPLVLLPETPQYGILSEKTTVVRTPQFYYHFTTIDGCDLPHFAVFCFFHDRVTFCSQNFEVGKLRQNGAEYGFSGG